MRVLTCIATSPPQLAAHCPGRRSQLADLGIATGHGMAELTITRFVVGRRAAATSDLNSSEASRRLHAQISDSWRTLAYLFIGSPKRLPHVRRMPYADLRRSAGSNSAERCGRRLFGFLGRFGALPRSRP